jgi:hypothetical protein
MYYISEKGLKNVGRSAPSEIILQAPLLAIIRLRLYLEFHKSIEE